MRKGKRQIKPKNTDDDDYVVEPVKKEKRQKRQKKV